jgi:hypothetical protein
MRQERDKKFIENFFRKLKWSLRDLKRIMFTVAYRGSLRCGLDSPGSGEGPVVQEHSFKSLGSIERR